MEGTLESGVVMREHKMAWCTFLTDDGRRHIVKIPLTDEELRAHAEHPSTFFGVLDRNAGRKPLKTAMDCFEFLWEANKDTTRERLLERLAKVPDFQSLKEASRDELATHYCALMASQMMANRQAGGPPTGRPETGAPSS